ncbi:YkvA family protein [Henriciella sp. AS95]|uniref:YkvA family protein n=1 Tax=Henriciella sp. AS95 TaxID=3135782 RepID=UPI00317E2B4B
MRNPTEIIIENGESQPRRLPIDVEADRRRTKRKFMTKLLKVAGRLPFADDLAASYYAAMDPKTPKKAKAVLFAALGYFVVPTDALPDVIAGLGFTDDATVLATALGIVGSQIKEKHRRAARRLLGLPEPASPKED